MPGLPGVGVGRGSGVTARVVPSAMKAALWYKACSYTKNTPEIKEEMRRSIEIVKMIEFQVVFFNSTLDKRARQALHKTVDDLELMRQWTRVPIKTIQLVREVNKGYTGGGGRSSGT